MLVSEVATVAVALTVITTVVYQTGIIRGRIHETCRRVNALEEWRKSDMREVRTKLEELSVQMARVEAKLE